MVPPPPGVGQAGHPGGPFLLVQTDSLCPPLSLRVGQVFPEPPKLTFSSPLSLASRPQGDEGPMGPPGAPGLEVSAAGGGFVGVEPAVHSWATFGERSQRSHGGGGGAWASQRGTRTDERRETRGGTLTSILTHLLGAGAFRPFAHASLPGERHQPLLLASLEAGEAGRPRGLASQEETAGRRMPCLEPNPASSVLATAHSGFREVLVPSPLPPISATDQSAAHKYLGLGHSSTPWRTQHAFLSVGLRLAMLAIQTETFKMNNEPTPWPQKY